MMTVGTLVSVSGELQFGSLWGRLASIGVVLLVGAAAVKMYRAGAAEAAADWRENEPPPP
jgi:hypothetical protein